MSDGSLRFIEVKGRVKDAREVVVTRDEMLTGFNKLEQYILVIVLVTEDSVYDGGDVFEMHEDPAQYGADSDCEVQYIMRPFGREPGFAETSAVFSIRQLLEVE